MYLYNKVVKEYLNRNTDYNVGIPYQEVNTSLNDELVICSIYKIKNSKTYYLQVTQLYQGRYDFNVYKHLSRFCTEDEVQRSLVINNVVVNIKAFSKAKQHIVSEIKKLNIRSIIDVTFDSNLRIYHIDLTGKFSESVCLDNRNIYINLPDSDLLKLSKVMNKYSIKINEEIGGSSQCLIQ